MKLTNQGLNLFFLAAGLFLLFLGYQIIQPTKDFHTTHDLKMGFFLTVFGSLVLGKWLSDYFISRKSKKK